MILSAHVIPTSGPVDKGPLPGNPNVILVSLGKLISEETGQLTFFFFNITIKPSLSAVQFDFQSYYLMMTSCMCFTYFQSYPY